MNLKEFLTNQTGPTIPRIVYFKKKKKKVPVEEER